MAAISKHVVTGTGDVQGVSGKAVLVGWSVRESAAVEGVATVILRDGTAATDPAVGFIELAASKSETQWLAQGVTCAGGVFVDRVAGETELVLFYH